MLNQEEYIEGAIRGAAECVLWQAPDATDTGNGFPISDGGNEYSERVIAEVPYITEAVTAFVRDNWDDLTYAYDVYAYGCNYPVGQQAGHDLILTANGHGTGFWDSGLGRIGTELSDACKGYSFDAEFALEDGDVAWLSVEDHILVDNGFMADYDNGRV